MEIIVNQPRRFEVRLFFHIHFLGIFLSINFYLLYRNNFSICFYRFFLIYICFYYLTFIVKFLSLFSFRFCLTSFQQTFPQTKKFSTVIHNFSTTLYFRQIIQKTTIIFVQYSILKNSKYILYLSYKLVNQYLASAFWKLVNLAKFNGMVNR